jgi:hypothetical protein
MIVDILLRKWIETKVFRPALENAKFSSHNVTLEFHIAK